MGERRLIALIRQVKNVNIFNLINHLRDDSVLRQLVDNGKVVANIYIFSRKDKITANPSLIP